VNKPSMRKWLLVAIGVLSVGLATAGIFLPVLPTTPFLLLAAACFVRSSDRFYRWLINHRVFGAYIRNYREHRAITLQAKIVTLTLLWATIGYSAFVVIDSLPVRIVLLLIAVGVTAHVLCLRTCTPEMMGQSAAEEAEEGSA